MLLRSRSALRRTDNQLLAGRLKISRADPACVHHRRVLACRSGRRANFDPAFPSSGIALKYAADATSAEERNAASTVDQPDARDRVAEVLRQQPYLRNATPGFKSFVLLQQMKKASGKVR